MVELTPSLSIPSTGVLPLSDIPPQYALVAGRQAGISSREQPKLARYAAAALALHLAVAAFFILRPVSMHRIGIEQGLPETVSVSVEFNAADLKRLSSDPFYQDGQPVPDSTAEAQTPVRYAQPMIPPSKPAFQDAKTVAFPAQVSPSPGKTYDASDFATMAAQQFSSQLKQAFKAVEARRDAEQSKPPQRPVQVASNVRLSRPGASRSGKSNEFEREVIWALAATRPMGNGKPGSSLVSFTISTAGRVEGLTLLQSSGDKWLDEGALMAVKQAHMPVPAPELTVGDRTFHVEYISLPGR